MNILAIDTTTKVAGVSIKYKNNIISNIIDNDITHSEKLLPLIDKTLNEVQLTLNDISTLACINGPGSFTGIRIGLATIKAISQVKKLDIFSISSLELMAISAYTKTKLYKECKQAIVASFIDARNDRVYFSLYKVKIDENNKILCKEILPIQNDKIDIAITNVSRYIIDNNLENMLISGDCINKFKNVINDKFYTLNILDYLSLNLYPTTNDLIYIVESIKNYDNYIFNAFTLNATYARLSQAERVKNEQGNK